MRNGTLTFAAFRPPHPGQALTRNAPLEQFREEVWGPRGMGNIDELAVAKVAWVSAHVRGSVRALLSGRLYET